MSEQGWDGTDDLTPEQEVEHAKVVRRIAAEHGFPLSDWSPQMPWWVAAETTCHRCGQSGVRYVTHVCPQPDDAQRVYTSADPLAWTHVNTLCKPALSSEDATRPTGDKE